MDSQTHYQLLQVDANATNEMIKLSYDRLLQITKNNLGDSPLYFSKEEKLIKAYETLIKADTRQIYNEQLEYESLLANKRRQTTALKPKSEAKIRGKNKKIDQSSNPFIFLGQLIFSKSFLGAIILIIILIVIIPSGKDQIVEDAIKKQHEIQTKQLQMHEKMRQQEISYQQQSIETRNANRKERKEAYEVRRQQSQRESDLRKFEREQQNIERNEIRLARSEEKNKKQQEYQLKREKKERQRKLERDTKKLERSRRDQEYAAKRRLEKMLSEQKRESYVEKKNEKISSAKFGN